MSRISDIFSALQTQGKTALIPFITAGDPDPQMTVTLMHAMVKAGADIIELGVPFSDPMAEGPVIQRACERALRHHVSLRGVLDMVIRFRLQDTITPVVLMGYLNPVEVMGVTTFASLASQAGVDGVITVDCPPEEAGGEYTSALQNEGLDPIFLIAPTSTPERITMISAMASGFVYYVSLKGVTGAASLDVQSVENKLAQIRSLTSMPIGVGFGIKDAATAACIARVADAVVVGSALISIIEKAGDDHGRLVEQVSDLLSGMRAAIDGETADIK